jgi:SAM-dependent methyltransferase
MHGHDEDNAREWAQRYAEERDGDPMWSGRANGTLVAEVGDLAPGTALDVGCGEGGDAIWLAHQGWQVTAIDPSRVALDRAEVAARAAGVEVAWVHAGLLGMPDGTGRHDLVSAQYAVLRHTDDGAAIAALLGAVAPGGTLLFVHHDLDTASDAEHAHADEHGHDAEHGFDPSRTVAGRRAPRPGRGPACPSGGRDQRRLTRALRSWCRSPRRAVFSFNDRSREAGKECLDAPVLPCPQTPR